MLRRPSSASAAARASASIPEASALQESSVPDLPNVQHNEHKISIGWTDGVWSRL